MTVKHRETARHLEAFEDWYAANRDFRKNSEKLGIAAGTLRSWAERFGWQERADRRDVEAAAIAEREAIQRRAEMLQRHREAAELLVKRGVEFLTDRELENGREATTAIKTGVELERQVEGLPVWVGKILNANASELRQLIADIDGRLAAGESAGDAAALRAGTAGED